VGNGAGVVESDARPQVTLKCSGQRSIGGIVSGLSAGEHVQLVNESQESLTVSANGRYQFDAEKKSGQEYSVVVNQSPPGKKCTIAGEQQGVVGIADITDLAVTCATLPHAQEFEEYGSEQELSVTRFQKLPSSILKITDKACEDIGAPYPLSGQNRLWVTTATNTNCMGSGGVWMSVILDIVGQKPREVLGTSAVAGIKLDRTSSHHDLPDAIVEWASAREGPGAALYEFDGKEYKVISALRSGSFDDFTGVTMPDDVKAVLGDYGASKGCTVSGGPITLDGYADVALFVVSSCSDENKLFPVWVVMFTPKPHVILRDSSTDSVDLGPKHFQGQPDICLRKCWRFNGKQYVTLATRSE